jgi:hypothetical protein
MEHGAWSIGKNLYPNIVPMDGTVLDPFGGVNPRLLRQGKETPLRVNREQARAFGATSRRVDKVEPHGLSNLKFI